VVATRWGCYERISDDKTGEGLGVADQSADNAAHAARLGGEVVDSYTDNSISASSGVRRPEYERMVADLRSGRITGVVAWHTDRLHRTPRELEDFIDVVESVGARVETVTAGPVDLSTTEGRMMARIACAIARREVEHKGERVRRRLESKAEAGRPHGGPRAYGFGPDHLAPVPEEQDVIREAARRVLAGESLAAVSRDLNRRGLLTARGGRWRTTTLRDCLLSYRWAGLREHKGRVFKAAWEPVLDEVTFKRLQTYLTDPSRHSPKRGEASQYLFAGGLLRCARCESPMRPFRYEPRSYRCAQKTQVQTEWAVKCGTLVVVAEPLEAHVATLLLARYSTPERLAALTDAAAPVEDGEVAASVAADVARLAELEVERADGLLDRDSFYRMSDRLRSRIAANRALLLRTRSIEVPDIDLVDLVGWWNSASPADHRAMFALTIDTVWVSTTQRRDGFDRGRVRVDWR
jgi:site-specific DNA recombinase